MDYPSKNYNQVLDDFAINELLQTIKSVEATSDYEADLIAVLLIRQISNSLNPTIINQYRQAIHDSTQTLHSLDLFMPPQSIELPPLQVPQPKFKIPNDVKLTPIDGASEWGYIIGYYLAYSPHQLQWVYRYIIYLDKTSPSVGWVSMTTAWEEEIECGE